MILVKPSHKILVMPTIDDVRVMERAGRTCYASHDKITEDSYMEFIPRMIRSGHESVIEHGIITVLFVTDRGTSHELVRHRLASYSQQSQRYVLYKDDVAFVAPCCVVEDDMHELGCPSNWWKSVMYEAEETYQDLIDIGWTPEQARSVLPNSTATEIVMSANPREWRHILKLRCSKKAHPEMRRLMLPLRDDLARICPVLFGDLVEE